MLKSSRGTKELKMLKVKLLHEAARVPKRAHDEDAGFDLYCVDPVTIYPGQHAVVPSGIAMQIPTGYAGFIWPRSGLASKHAIDTLAGLIDSTYRGEIKVSLINHGERAVELKQGDRIAQIVIQPISLLHPMLVDDLDDSERGQRGFGSTGL
jgi:dUTP pyrophosphatase